MHKKNLHEKAVVAGNECKDRYALNLQELAGIYNEIFALDELFRRGPGGGNMEKTNKAKDSSILVIGAGF